MKLQRKIMFQSYAPVLVLFVLVGSVAGEEPKWRDQGDESFVVGENDEQIFFRVVRPCQDEAYWDLWLRGEQAQFYIFLVEEPWKQKELNRAEISCLTLEGSGEVLRLSANWYAASGDLALVYTLALRATADGVAMELEFETKQKLVLLGGIRCGLSLDAEAYPREDNYLYAKPSAHFQLGSYFHGACEQILIGQCNQRAITLSGEGLVAIESELWPGSQENGPTFEVKATLMPTPDPLPAGTCEQVTATVGFDTMPETFPDDIVRTYDNLEIRRVQVPPTAVPQYGKIELTVDLAATWQNPFDPDEVKLDAIVEFPSGKEVCQPGFFMIDHQRKTGEYTEMMVPEGPGKWRVRICALEPGPVECTLVAKDESGTKCKEVEGIRVVGSDNSGFIRPSQQSPHYLRFDDGKTFFPIGHALDTAILVDCTLNKMASNGENCNRWWMRSDEFGLEWDRLGWYRQSPAAQLDRLVEIGAQLGMYWVLTFDDSKDFRMDDNRWLMNPYNEINGGPCGNVDDWFTSSKAQKLQHNRLRYIVARWGYSPHVFCWELGNEFNVWIESESNGKSLGHVRQWHEKVARYLAHIDPYQRPITTSFSSERDVEEIWNISDIELVQTHRYINDYRNVAEQVQKIAKDRWGAPAKPHFLGEFGIFGGANGKWAAEHDPTGRAVHNALWSAVCSGCCGAPMPWWHDTYVDALNLYPQFAAVSRFVADVPFAANTWQHVSVACDGVRYQNESELKLSDLYVFPTEKREKRTVSTFTVQRTGDIDGAEELNGHLFPQGDERRNPPKFLVNFLADGTFIVHLAWADGRGLVQVSVDGHPERTVTHSFQAGEHVGRSQEQETVSERWESDIDQEIKVTVPAGPQKIRVQNLGMHCNPYGDYDNSRNWVLVTHYGFLRYQRPPRPNILVAGLSSFSVDEPEKPGMAIVWIQNRDSTWYQHYRNAVVAVPPSVIQLDGFPNGEYRVEWWNTRAGVPNGADDVVTVTDGKLELRPGRLVEDTAAKIFRP